MVKFWIHVSAKEQLKRFKNASRIHSRAGR